MKTRLAKSIGIHKAALLSRIFVDVLLKRTEHKKYQRIIFYTPADKKKEIIDWLGSDIIIQPQKGNDLGQRLSRAFAFAFKIGAKKVVAIGTDNPLIDKKTLQEAFKKLSTKACVLGPALDGGYYLIGLTSLNERIFKGIPWSTQTVFRQTIQRLKRMKAGYSLLKKSFDVDTYQDIQLLRQRIGQERRKELKGLEPLLKALEGL